MDIWMDGWMDKFINFQTLYKIHSNTFGMLTMYETLRYHDGNIHILK